MINRDLFSYPYSGELTGIGLWGTAVTFELGFWENKQVPAGGLLWYSRSGNEKDCGVGLNSP